MKAASWSGLASLAIAASLTSLSSAQQSQDPGGRPSGGAAPAPTYVAPPPVYQPAPGGGGGYPPGYGTPYQPAPPPPGPARMKYSEGDPVPPGYRVENRTRTGLVIGGSIMFGIMYGVTASFGGTGTDTGWLYVPVAGPFIYSSTLDSEWAGIARFFLYMDGLIQAGGAAMLIVGLVGKTELVRNDIAKVSVMPMVGKASGLSLLAEF